MKVRLTPLGKLVAGGLVALFLLAGYLLFFRGGDDDWWMYPADTGHWNFPAARAEERAEFARQAKQITRYCSLFSPETHWAIRGMPIRMAAFVPPNFHEGNLRPYYYRDAERKMEFFPAFLITPDAHGLANAFAFAQGNTDNLPECASIQLGNSDGLILLGFPDGQPPASPLINLYGIVWWDSLSLNPAQQDTPAGANTGIAPVILVHHYERLSPFAVHAPARQIRPVNLTIRRNDTILRISRVELATRQTRVWVQIINRRQRTLDPWIGLTGEGFRLCVAGGRCLGADDVSFSATAAADDAGTDLEELFDQVQGLDDRLPDQPVDPGGVLSGYVIFPAVPLESSITLRLADPSMIDTADGSLPITIRVPRPADSSSSRKDGKQRRS